VNRTEPASAFSTQRRTGSHQTGPRAAFADLEFATAARELESRTFIAHVRYATTGAHTAANTHPFEQDGRLFAHNGTFGDLDKIDSRLTELHGTDLVLGQTDSERMFALITTETRRHNGDLQPYACFRRLG
jgi:predicted glutamine amidotransferase